MLISASLNKNNVVVAKNNNSVEPTILSNLTPGLELNSHLETAFLLKRRTCEYPLCYQKLEYFVLGECLNVTTQRLMNYVQYKGRVCSARRVTSSVRGEGVQYEESSRTARSFYRV